MEGVVVVDTVEGVKDSVADTAVGDPSVATVEVLKDPPMPSVERADSVAVVEDLMVLPTTNTRMNVV